MKKQLVFVLSVLMKMQQQCIASLKNRSVLGLLMCIVILVSFTTKVYPQTEWTKYEGNPVLDPEPAGNWDDELVGTPCVLFDGTIYHMWYGGYDGTYMRIGYAMSQDGIIWTKHPNPVLDVGPAGSWDDAWVLIPCVLFDGSIYKMWYTGGDGNFERTGYATSPDPVSWTKHPDNPVLDVGPAGSWDDIIASSGCVLFDGSAYDMWYHGNDGVYIRIGHATSPDGINWTKYPDNPILDVGSAGSWDNSRVQNPCVIFDGTTYHMWYSGGGLFNWRIGYATSSDPLSFEKYANNPVLDVGPAGSWDDYYVGLCSVIFDTPTSTYKMWYTGGDGAWYGSIGYATSTTIGINENTIVQTKNYLHQNYPNPFNPETTISYQLPENSKVELTVYNLKGQKVKTLINELLSAGEHSVIWDGRDSNGNRVGSGIYFYKMKAETMIETRKMLLLK